MAMAISPSSRSTQAGVGLGVRLSQESMVAAAILIFSTMTLWPRYNEEIR
jgi:hypothetical protein